MSRAEKTPNGTKKAFPSRSPARRIQFFFSFSSFYVIIVSRAEKTPNGTKKAFPSRSPAKRI